MICFPYKIKRFSRFAYSTTGKSNNMPSQSSTSLRLFAFLCIFRVLNTFLIQSYFDPDEFWQTMEPAYCSVFRRDEGFACPGFTWEWKRRDPDPTNNFISQSLLGPARTYLSVLPTHVMFRILQNFHLDSSWWVSRGPMILYATTVAAPTDFCVWYAAKVMYPSSSIPWWCLFASLSSWFNAYSMVRTLANGQEAFLFISSICLVGHRLLLGDKGAKQKTKSKSFQAWRAQAAFFLGGLCVSIRGTSVAAYVPMGILLAVQEPTLWRTIHFLFSVCAMFGLLGIGVGVAVDYWYFGFATLPFLGNFHFNVVLDYATLFGAHPWYWYLTAGIPALVGILLPVLVADFASPGSWSKGRRNLWIIVTTYICAMSTNGHKEFRYILPLLPIFCLLAGEQLQGHLGRERKGCVRYFVLVFIAIGNLIAVLYLGLFHQSGQVTVNREILRLSEGKTGSNASPFSHRVHYWTGACHSTPLLSALHSPFVRFETRQLDCSPSCRADPGLLCETDQFHQSPLGFLQSVYQQQSCNVDEADDKICQDIDMLPSFVVTTSNYVDALLDYLEEMGMQEVSRFPNKISGAKIAGHRFGDDFTDPSHGHKRFTDYLEISIEEVILFAHKPIQGQA